MFLTIVLASIMTFNIVLAFTVIFLEHKNAPSTWAWVMVLFFLPVVGFLLYLVFGRKLSRKKIFTWDTKSRHGVKQEVAAQMEALEAELLTEKQQHFHTYKDLFYLHLKNNDAVYSEDNQVKIYTDGREKFNDLMNDLKQAKDHIHLVYYIVRSDALGQQIANILIAKAKEGVTVRLLYDDMGSRRIGRKFIRKLKASGVEVDAFFPPLIPKVNFKINFRNHRKIAVIDGKIGYLGGFNIGDEYLGKSKKFGYWRDTHVRVSGNAVRQLQTRFILDWNQASRNDILYEKKFYATESRGEVGMQIVSSGPDSDWEQIKYGYIKMILSAKKYVYIQTPYFIPDESLMDAVRIAALSGVKIKIMVPNKPDHPFVHWATLSYVGELLSVGAEIFIYQKGFLHAKTIVVDGLISSIGTANIDMRSFRLNFEVNAFFYDLGIAEQLESAFAKDSLDCTQMTKELYLQRPFRMRFKESISRLLSPIL